MRSGRNSEATSLLDTAAVLRVKHQPILTANMEICFTSMWRGPAKTLRAIYFDNEGHVINYSVSAPAPGNVIFLSDPAVPGPQFRLTYALKDGVMSGKFQMHMPGQNDWRSYLE
jgi:hypothetical protein